jgi:acetoin utilization deacetylase AcuC-like enzyme
MGAMGVSTQGFAGLTQSVMEIAESNCDGRLVLSLEGGYDLAALRDSVKTVLLELAGMTTTDPATFLAMADRRKMDRVLRKAWSVHARNWPSLASSLETRIRRPRSPMKWLGDLRDEIAAYMRS